MRLSEDRFNKEKLKQTIPWHLIQDDIALFEKFTVLLNEDPSFIQSFMNQSKNGAFEGDTNAQLFLAICLEYGILYPCIPKGAYEYYQLAVDVNDPRANRRLGLAYLNGELGLPKDLLKALVYLEKAASQGDSKAILELYRSYEKGFNSDSFEQSFHNPSVPLGSQDSQNIRQMEEWAATLADLYREGMNKSLKKAVYYFILSKSFKNDLFQEIYFRWLQGKINRFEDFKKYTFQNLNDLKQEAMALQSLLREQRPHFLESSEDRKFSEKITEIESVLTNQNQMHDRIEKSIERELDLLLTVIPNSSSSHVAEPVISQTLHEDMPSENWESFLKMKELADQEDTSCQRDVALLYLFGIGFDQSAKEAFKYYEKAAEGGDSLSQLKVGMAYLEGDLGVSKNPESAVHYFQLAADQDDVRALLQLSECYEKGVGITQSSEKSFTILEYAYQLERFKPESKFLEEILTEIGRHYKNGIGVEKSLDKAIEFYTKAEELGGAMASYQLFSCNEELNKQKGRTLIDDDLNALMDDLNCEENNPIDSLFKDLKTLSHKDFTEEDSPLETLKDVRESSVQILQYTADALKTPFAQYEMGLHIENNGEKDLHKAFHYFQLAADQGQVDAMAKMAYYYSIGKGTTPSREKAFSYVKSAADRGDSESQIVTALCYMRGLGVDSSFDKALNYLQMGIETLKDEFLHSYLYMLMGDCYAEKGAEFVTKSFQNYQKSANLGLAEAQVKLAQCYIEGKGVAKNDLIAAEWLQKAY